MLSFKDILSFLSPYSGELEILPIVFFTIILFLFLYTIINLFSNAKSNNWEKNWQTNKLDIEQGSLSELSQCVATKSENLADIMPGMILIVGLLGTFIGLGLALDKASHILTSASNMNSLNGSMEQLMQMMQGLGTKFKTSTWGLIAFLLLKFICARNNYEERRLNWVSTKVKSILDGNRQKQQEKYQQQQENLLSSITQLTNTLSETQTENRNSNENLLNNVNKQQLEAMNSGYFAVQEANNAAHKTLLESLNQLFKQQSDLFTHQHNEFKEVTNKMSSSLTSTFNHSIDGLINKQLENTTNLLNYQERANKENAQLLLKLTQEQNALFSQQHDEFKEVSHMMSDTLSHTIDTSFENLINQQLEQARENQGSLKELASKICTSIEIQQKQIIAAVDKNSNFLDKTAQESERTRSAMDKFVTESLKTIESLKESAGGMSEAALNIGQSAGKLQSVIDLLSTEMNDLMSRMKQDLGETISNMDKNFVENMDKMTKGLNSTIGDMNLTFKQNMTEMSEGLGKATKDISHSVTELSTSVDKTMTNVSSEIKQSTDLQRKSQQSFDATARLLQEKIIAMKELVETLSGDITGGLRAVSESNRNMTALNKRYNSSSEQIESLVNSVKEVVTKNQSLLPVLNDISHKIPNHQQLLNEISQKMPNNQPILNIAEKIAKTCEKLEMLNLILTEQKKQTEIQSALGIKNDAASKQNEAA